MLQQVLLDKSQGMPYYLVRSFRMDVACIFERSYFKIDGYFVYVHTCRRILKLQDNSNMGAFVRKQLY